VRSSNPYDIVAKHRPSEVRKCQYFDLCLDISAQNDDHYVKCVDCNYKSLTTKNINTVELLIYYNLLKKKSFAADFLFLKHTGQAVEKPGRLKRRISERPNKVSILQKKEAYRSGYLRRRKLQEEAAENNGQTTQGKIA